MCRILAVVPVPERIHLICMVYTMLFLKINRVTQEVRNRFNIVNGGGEMGAKTLHRGISETQITWVTIGGIIGSCYFLGAGLVLEELGVLAPIAFAVAGIVVFAVMQAMSELQVNVPKTSSFVGYSKEFLGNPIACGIGVTYALNWMFYIPSEAVAGGTIANMFLPSISTNIFAVLFLALILGLNLVKVSNFSKVETVLAIAKVLAIILFCIFAVFAIFGIMTNPVGLSILKPELAEKTAMIGVGTIGVFIFAGQMLMLMMSQTPILLVNYQGSEIIGLAASETQNPAEAIPKAAKNSAYRIVGMFVLPMFLLCMIFPAAKAGVASSPFADALAANGFGWLGIVFTVVVLISAFSCANSGFYAGVRAIRGLAIEKLIPGHFSDLNSNAVPMNAAILMAGGCIAALAGSIWYGESNLYASLLSMSGITGALCWVSFGVCVFVFRRKLIARNYDLDNLRYKSNIWFVMAFAVILQSVGIVSLAFSEDYQLPFYLSAGIMAIAMISYKVCALAGLTDEEVVRYEGEPEFEQLYPVRVEVS